MNVPSYLDLRKPPERPIDLQEAYAISDFPNLCLLSKYYNVDDYQVHLQK